MKTYQFIVRRSNGSSDRPVVAQGVIEASRTAVAVKRAAEEIPNTTKFGEWFHVSIVRVKADPRLKY